MKILKDDETNLQRCRINLLETELEEKKEILNSRNEEVEKRHKKIAGLEEELVSIKERITVVSNQIKEVEEKRAEAENDLEEMNSLIEISKKLLKTMNDILLIHTSAMLYQLYKHQCEEIWISEVDLDFFSELEDRTGGIFSAEKVFHRVPVDMKLPKDFFEKYKNRELELQSIIAFCEMVLYLKNNKSDDRKVFLAYRNIDIYRILKLNGIQEFKF